MKIMACEKSRFVNFRKWTITLLGRQHQDKHLCPEHLQKQRIQIVAQPECCPTLSFAATSEWIISETAVFEEESFDEIDCLGMNPSKLGIECCHHSKHSKTMMDCYKKTATKSWKWVCKKKVRLLTKNHGFPWKKYKKPQDFSFWIKSGWSAPYVSATGIFRESFGCEIRWLES